jgi:hypothetical protein
MLINRNNYEQFFLLYADGELSKAETAAVDAFVQANPDLATELQMLMEAVLQPEPMLLPNKSSLLKPTPVTEAMQELLLLKLDGELSNAQLKTVDDALLTDTTAQNEWQLLQQTQLPAQAVLHPNKAALYRQTTGRVVALRWYRIAAAALLIGFGVWGTVTLLQAPAGKPDTVNQLPTGSNTPIPVPGNNPVQSISGTATITNSTVAKEKQPAVAANNNNTLRTAGKNDADAGAVNNPSAKKRIQDGNTAALQQAQKISLTDFNENKSNITTNPSVSPLITPEKIKSDVAINTALPNAPAETFTRLLQDDNQQNEGIVYGFAEPEDEPRKTKVGGLLKRLKRTIQRKANLPGGDGNIRVANMSFAVK